MDTIAKTAKRLTSRTLNEIVDYHLFNALVESDRPDAVITLVLNDYVQELRRAGQLQAQFEHEVVEELREIALEIIRKRTYGCTTIGAFRKR